MYSEAPRLERHLLVRDSGSVDQATAVAALIRRCAWCGRRYGDTGWTTDAWRAADTEHETATICPDCAAELRELTPDPPGAVGAESYSIRAATVVAVVRRGVRPEQAAAQMRALLLKLARTTTPCAGPSRRPALPTQPTHTFPIKQILPTRS